MYSEKSLKTNVRNADPHDCKKLAFFKNFLLFSCLHFRRRIDKNLYQRVKSNNDQPKLIILNNQHNVTELIKAYYSVLCGCVGVRTRAATCSSTIPTRRQNTTSGNIQTRSRYLLVWSDPEFCLAKLVTNHTTQLNFFT